MKRLIEGIGKNSPQEYDRIFEERGKKEPDWFDVRRWKELTKFYRKGKLLDVGCLDSIIPELISWKKYVDYYLGIDVCVEAIKKMQIKYPESHYALTDIFSGLVFKNYFDYIVAGEVLEHLDDPNKAIKEMFECLKSGGILSISVPLEETELGEVDKERHVWSFSKQDMYDLLSPYSSKIKIKILRSRCLPTYRYCWPQLICWAWKR